MEQRIEKIYLVNIDLDIYVKAENEKDLKEKIKPLLKYFRTHKKLDIDVNDISMEEY